MIIIGINSAYHEQAAAIIVDGQLVAAAEEERFNRIKHGKLSRVDNADDLPWQALEYCLKCAGVTSEEVDHIGYSFDPWLRYNYEWTDPCNDSIKADDFGTAEGERAFLQSNLRARTRLLSRMPQAKFHFLSHHLCHAGSAFLVSPYKEAGILVVDGIAEHASTWSGIGVAHSIAKMSEVEYPHSLGFLWEKLSEFLGFDRYDGPGKVMALGTSTESRGQSDNIDHLEQFRSFIKPTEDGFIIDSSVLRYRADDFRGLEKLFGPRKDIVQHSLKKASIASGLQSITEDILVHLANQLYDRINTESRHNISDLCLAGGVALNCVANTQIAERTPWKRLWVQPAAHDGGTALGAAVIIWNLVLGRTERIAFSDAYLGPEFTNSECEEALLRNGLPFNKPNGLSRRTAELIMAGKAVAWFQGRMEYGPRALGNRSILADPRRRETRSLLNDKIKEREGFRPFAPSVLESCTQEFFEVQTGSDKNSDPTQFMLMAVPVRKDKAESIPSVVHTNCDTGHVSSRIHRVKEGANPRYEETLETVSRLTGHPILLNTSFNISEPIVCDPNQACATFLKSDLDAMVLGSYLVQRI